jgi:membrane-associated phospholipid phosphatase
MAMSSLQDGTKLLFSPMTRNVVLVAIGLSVLLASPTQAQSAGTYPDRPLAARGESGGLARSPITSDTVKPSATAPGYRRSIEWYHGLAALGAIVLATTIDEPTQRHVQDHRTETKDDVAYIFRQLGEPEVFIPVALAPVAVGLISGNKGILRAGGRIGMSIVTAAVVTDLLKMGVGRKRPNATDNAYDFAPFSGNESWPSGHTSVAFAMVTSVGDEIGSLPVSIALYTAAGLTGWSRVNDNRHWFSDVLTGALVGVTSAKLMNGKWKVFGISQPKFLAGPKTVGVSLQF